MKAVTEEIRNDDLVAGSRMATAIRMEWLMLAMRYGTYVVLAVLSVAVNDTDLRRAFMIVGSSALIHNLFAHWVFYTKHFSLFFSAWNFLFYLLRFCLLVGISGGAASPFAPFFLLLVIGYHIYTPHAYNTLWITLLVCAAYSFTILSGWLVGGMQWAAYPVYINLFFISLSGWIMGILARMLRALEKETNMKAAALESSEATLRAILDNTAHPIVVYDENELISEVNESACNFLGLPKHKIIGVRFQTFVFDDGVLSQSLTNVKKTGVLHQEMLVLSASGQEHNVYMHIHSFLGEGKRLFVALFHDITNQKELQEANRLAKLNLEKANQELQRVVELRAAFYINVANRLRSPLASILGFTDMLLEEQLGELADEQRKALHSCRRSLMRIFEQLDEVFVMEKAPTPRETFTQPESQLDVGDGAGI